MPDSEDTWPEPEYSPGSPKHLHAIGVISMNYNAFETSLYSLYRFHLDRKKIPKNVSDLYYFNSNEQLRVALVKAAFDDYERSAKVRTVLESSLKFFNWCATIRNHVLHSAHYPALFGRTDDAIHLIKRKSKRSAEPAYLRFDLSELREFADAIQKGHQHAVRLHVYLRQRGRSARTWPVWMQIHGHEPLPEILQPPSLPKLADHPIDPIPPPPQKPSRG